MSYPGLYGLLWPIVGLWHPAVLAVGDVLLIAGFGSVVAIHMYMGCDWRSGARPNGSTSLLTTGPFVVSRNPMMLGVLVAQIGFFLALPSAFSLICLGVGVGAITVQVGIEERYLRDRFGDTYSR